jgi:hypothetical protein
MGLFEGVRQSSRLRSRDQMYGIAMGRQEETAIRELKTLNAISLGHPSERV